ncbi:MAG: 1-acyl-sn-glycerol-3-phosphate acyltransferase [Treponema sp.]|nr:1-acyl-sn-glycerol-3-phosphate acyltransferase [Treponema sp.]MCL2238052.1 1-acyl-sn-glycerol-3-phosphate acyltransferase [Treponema sp.]
MIRTILGFGYLAFAMAFLLPFALIAGFFYLLGLRKPMKLIIYRLAQGWAKSLIPVAGCKATATGRENIPKKGNVCFVCNHNGFFDIVMLLAFCGRPFGFVAKKELSYVPFLNVWIFMLGGLFIDRKNVRNAIRTINKGVDRVRAGGGMLIFPEGHRSKGRGLLPFHPGSLKLATQAGAVIVPVAIEGSYDVFEKNNRVVKASARIAFLPQIDTAAMPLEDKKQVLCDRIYTAIKEELGY